MTSGPHHPPAVEEQEATLTGAKRPTIFTTRTWPNGEEESEEKDLEVKLFESHPAEVYVECGRTLNMGNYESFRMTIGVKLPCYPEEVNETIGYATTMAGQAMAAEEEELRKIGAYKGPSKF